ncbi:MAG: hypothetical protein H7X92_02025 [Chitinophagales bacterium]|nr:hypothetical protein [Hyphomicrobiales bacterium]
MGSFSTKGPVLTWGVLMEPSQQSPMHIAEGITQSFVNMGKMVAQIVAILEASS